MGGAVGGARLEHIPGRIRYGACLSPETEPQSFQNVPPYTLTLTPTPREPGSPCTWLHLQGCQAPLLGHVVPHMATDSSFQASRRVGLQDVGRLCPSLLSSICGAGIGAFNKRTPRRGAVRFGTVTFTLPATPLVSGHLVIQGLARLNPRPSSLRRGAAKTLAQNSANKTAIPDTWIHLALAPLPLPILACIRVGQNTDLQVRTALPREPGGPPGTPVSQQRGQRQPL